MGEGIWLQVEDTGSKVRGYRGHRVQGKGFTWLRACELSMINGLRVKG
jgi:hypothetical protein